MSMSIYRYFTEAATSTDVFYVEHRIVVNAFSLDFHLSLVHSSSMWIVNEHNVLFDFVYIVVWLTIKSRQFTHNVLSFKRVALVHRKCSRIISFAYSLGGRVAIIYILSAISSLLLLSTLAANEQLQSLQTVNGYFIVGHFPNRMGQRINPLIVGSRDPNRFCISFIIFLFKSGNGP